MPSAVANCACCGEIDHDVLGIDQDGTCYLECCTCKTYSLIRPLTGASGA
jgi:hypothetical protein